MGYAAYREMRSAALLAYCHGIKMRLPQVIEAIGIASEPFSEEIASQDFVYVDLSAELSPEESAVWKEAMEELDVLRTPAKDMRYFSRKGHEFPMPFDFSGPKFYELERAAPMSRAERRREAREARKAAKKKNKQKR